MATVPPLLYRSSIVGELTETLISCPTEVCALQARRASNFQKSVCCTTLFTNSNRFKGAADSQVMKKYLTIRPEPSLRVKHFRCTVHSRV